MTNTTHRTHLLLAGCLPALLLVSACSDDDDDPLPPAGPTAFSGQLSESATIPAAQMGSRLRVTVVNRAPAGGTLQTPVWVGLHDGTFDLYNLLEPASLFFPVSQALERLAEDGTTGPLMTDFEAAGFPNQATLAGELTPGPLESGEAVTYEFEIDPSDIANRYFSYSSMVLPSNDAFVANGDPMAHQLFDTDGTLLLTDFAVFGSEVLDAGTEDNDEAAENTAFFGQTTGNTGVDENGNVALHPGFITPDAGDPTVTILEDSNFANGDFTLSGYRIFDFRFELVGSTAPSGRIEADLVNSDTQVVVDIAVAGLSGPVTSASLHEAAVGVAGPSVLDLGSGITNGSDGQSTVAGTFTAPAGFAESLRDGNLYVSLQTALNPTGEVRAQLSDDETFLGALSSAQSVPTPVTGSRIRITATNLAPEFGTLLTPIAVGLHDGTFDIYDLGSPASAELERLAEDGTNAPLLDAIAAAVPDSRQFVLPGVLTPGPLAPGESTSTTVTLDPVDPAGRYLSWASMILPSNDAFIANDNPMAHEIFDTAGVFNTLDFIIPGSDVRDAGTEVNDELDTTTAFFGQTVADAGTPESLNIATHSGFLAPDALDSVVTILEDPNFLNADFTAVGYEALRIRTAELAPAGPATGGIFARLDETETSLEFQLDVSGLSGEVTDLGLHDGAAGVAGPELLNIFDTITLNEDGRLIAVGTRTVDAAFVTLLRDGNVYVDVQTELNPEGEVRGQLLLDQ